MQIKGTKMTSSDNTRICIVFEPSKIWKNRSTDVPILCQCQCLSDLDLTIHPTLVESKNVENIGETALTHRSPPTPSFLFSTKVGFTTRCYT